jgi:hypothetical protein
VIVVVGHPALRPGTPPAAGGRASEVALEAARRGSRVELIGTCGDDRAGDALLIALASAGIGHAATLRDPARLTPVLAPLPVEDAEDADDEASSVLAADPPTRAAGPDTPGGPDAPGGPPRPTLDAADVALGLAYVTSFDVLVVTDDVAPTVLPAAIDAAAYAGAHLVVLVPDGEAVPADLPDAATALAAPGEADEGAFGALVGAYAAALDHGAAPGEAFAMAAGAAGWEALDTSRG